jgi:pyrimidine operon attenuation protein/uracil phosphoribosyltransferase
MAELKRIEAGEIARAVDRLVDEVAACGADPARLAIVGIANGGIDFAARMRDRLQERFGRELPAGTVDIAFHRDDIGRNPIPKASVPTDLSFDITGSEVLLCDDVICSGRTVRAALNELFDQGRPEAVRLAVLCDRGNRRLPFQPDFRGLAEETGPRQTVAVFLDNTEPSNDAILISDP